LERPFLVVIELRDRSDYVFSEPADRVVAYGLGCGPDLHAIAAQERSGDVVVVGIAGKPRYVEKNNELNPPFVRTAILQQAFEFSPLNRLGGFPRILEQLCDVETLTLAIVATGF
jgi:hypothetical protein